MPRNESTGPCRRGTRSRRWPVGSVAASAWPSTPAVARPACSATTRPAETAEPSAAADAVRGEVQPQAAPWLTASITLHNPAARASAPSQSTSGVDSVRSARHHHGGRRGHDDRRNGAQPEHPVVARARFGTGIRSPQDRKHRRRRASPRWPPWTGSRRSGGQFVTQDRHRHRVERTNDIPCISPTDVVEQGDDVSAAEH